MTDHTTPEPMTDIDPLRLILRLLDEVDRIRAQLDRAKAAAAWERGQRRSQSSTLGVKIDQLGIARAEKAALAARLAEAEQARDEARAEIDRQRHEREKYTERWDALDLQRLAALELHDVPFCETCNDHGPCETRRALDGDGVTACTGCGTCSVCRAHDPATATGAPDPDPSEGTAPTSPQEPTQGPREAPCLDSPAPLTLAQAATALHDWAGDLDDGARADWPAGHADVIRGIRAAADWLDARDKYEREAREQHLTAVREAGRRLGESFQQLGEAIHDGAAKARARREAEPAEPTLRDVIRTMRAAGLRLERRWGHQLLLGQGEERGVVTPGRSGDYGVTLYGRDGWCVEMQSPTPGDILAAARLAGLIGDTNE